MNSTSLSSSMTLNANKKQISRFEQCEWVHRRLLYDLMSSVYEFILVDYGTISNDSEHLLSSSAESQLLNVHTCLEQIFLNGFRILKPDKSPDLWRFIEALNWINPHMTVSIGTSNDSSARIPSSKSSRIRSDNALNWLYENLLSQQLESKLKCLLSDSEHLLNCYDVTQAFFFSRKFVDALYTCLDSFNRRKYNTLLQIDEKLYISVIDESIKSAAGSTYRVRYEDMSVADGHNRNVSNGQICDISTENANKSKICDHNHHSSLLKNSNVNSKLLLSNGRNRKQSGRHRCKLKHVISFKIRPWASLPEIRKHPKSNTRNLQRSKSQTISIKTNRMKLTVGNVAINDRQKVPPIEFKRKKSSTINLKSYRTNQTQHTVDDLQPINLVKCDDIKIHMDRRHASDRTADVSLNAPAFTSAQYSQETNANENVPGLLKTLPTKNNLLSFINAANTTFDEAGSPSKKSHSNTAPVNFATFYATNGIKVAHSYQSSPFLENFDSNSASVSPLCSHDECIVPNRVQSLASYLQETQQTKWNITDLERENAHFILSDAIISAIEEIKCSQMERKRERKNKISIAKTQKSHLKPKILKNWVIGDDEESDKIQRNLTDDESSSFLSEMTHISQSSSDSNLSHISSNSDSTTVSNVGGLKRLKTFTVSSHSINDHSAFAEWAENSIETLSAEGIALCLISKFKDYQLPRAADLLARNSEPLNELYRAQEFDLDGLNQIPYTRGTPDWAPPRFQIIFTRHPTPDRRNLIKQQNYRCAGCGMHIQSAFVYSLRYCEYSGKYHCTGCHRNQVSAIPARVLDRWDFSCHPVSVFSYRLLDRIWKVPLFRVPDLNQELYCRVRLLRYCRLRRLQLKYVHDFIQTCRFAEDDKVRGEFDSLPSYVYDDIDNWSMNDLVNVRNGIFLKTIDEIISKGEEHVFNCELCTAHGFICEYCRDNQVIFPWQSKVTRCTKCGSCAHITCSKNECQKCQRLEKLKKN